MTYYEQEREFQCRDCDYLFVAVVGVPSVVADLSCPKCGAGVYAEIVK